MYFETSKLTSTTHFFSLSFKDDKSARLPIIKPNAPNKIDFPAPVSPVIDSHQKSSQSQVWRSKKTDVFEAEVTSVTFLPKGNSIAIRYEHKQTIIIRNLETNKNTFLVNENIIGFSHPHPHPHPHPIAISPNGQYMASGIKKIGDNVIKLWNIEEKKEHKEIHGHENSEFSRIIPVAFTPDSEILISGCKDKRIFFWDVKTAGKRGELIENCVSEIRAIAVSPDKDNAIFAIGDSEGRIESGNWKTIRKIKSFPAHGSPNGLPINSLAFCPDGKILVSGGDDYRVKLWDVDRAEELKSEKHSAIVKTVGFSPDGKLIASGDDRGYIKIWDVETMTAVSVLKEHSSAVTSVAFSPDGKTLASGSKDKTVRFWERV